MVVVVLVLLLRLLLLNDSVILLVILIIILRVLLFRFFVLVTMTVRRTVDKGNVIQYHCVSLVFDRLGKKAKLVNWSQQKCAQIVVRRGKIGTNEATLVCLSWKKPANKNVHKHRKAHTRADTIEHQNQIASIPNKQSINQKISMPQIVWAGMRSKSEWKMPRTTIPRRLTHTQSQRYGNIKKREDELMMRGAERMTSLVVCVTLGEQKEHLK